MLQGLDLFPEGSAASASVLFTNMGEKEAAYAVSLASAFRAEGVACEVYPDNTKLKKQFEYADRKGIPWLAIVGDQEVSSGTVTLKNLASGEQQTLPKEKAVTVVK